MNLRVRLIRTGITRTVWLIGPYAVKVPSLRGGSWNRGGRLRGLAWSISRGIQANISEWEMARWEDIAHAVCPPVLCLAGIVNVYRRCDPLPAEEWARFPHGDLLDLPFGDKKIDNAGLLDGRPVWIDYDGSWNGCTHGPDLAFEALKLTEAHPEALADWERALAEEEARRWENGAGP